MIRLLRRSRLLALVLLLAPPAVGGAWLQTVHPCPVDTPWLAGHSGDHAEHGEQATPAGCHCVGSCAGVTVAVAPGAPVLAIAPIPAPVLRPRVTAATPAPAVRPSDLLPPSTAPPLL